MKKAISEILKNPFKSSSEGTKLGKIKGKLFFEERLTEGELNHHVHVVGASGFGKTVFLSLLMKDRIAQGKGLLFIDLKGDIETIASLSESVRKAGREKDFEIFSLADPNQKSKYNLLNDGTANQLRDRIITSLNWSEEYYKSQSSSFLLRLMHLLCWLRDQNKLKLDIGTVLRGSSSIEFLESLSEVVRRDSGSPFEALSYCIDFLNSQDNFKSLQGMRAQLESIVYSDFGEKVVAVENGIDLFEFANNSKIVFMFLDSRRYGETAKVLGKFILQDLKYTSAKIDAEILKGDRKPFTIVIDEFSDFAQEDFISFLDRARSSKMSVVVAHQELSDLRKISEEFVGRLMGNTSTLYAFLQKRPESADMIASIAGTKKVWKQTVQSDKLFGIDIPTGAKSLREVEEFNIHPNTIKSLRVGTCVCIKKYPNARSHMVAVSRDGV